MTPRFWQNGVVRGADKGSGLGFEVQGFKGFAV